VYVLYYAPGAASLAVHWLLIELGVSFEARRLDLEAQEHKRPEYLTLNPNGVVPTLLIDGKPVYESAALISPEGAAGVANVGAARGEARPRIEAAWDRIESHLLSAGPMMCGERLSAVDFFATMLMRWSRNMPRPATSWPAIASYVARMKSRPTFRELYAREGLTEWS
jgi:glutathione S-transferase